MLPKKTSFTLSAFLLSLVFIAQFSCKKNDQLVDNGTPNVPPVIANDATLVAATITGSVIDENNKPVVGAAVSADTYSTTTDAMGNFTFKNINMSAANGHVSVVKAGYFKGTRSFVTSANKNNFVKIQLIKQVVSGTVAAAAGGTITTDGATIAFAPNSFVTATGVAYTGNVKVYAKWIDPTAQNLPVIIPGDLRGLSSTNAESILKSYGMVGAELKDDAGNTLKIAPGKTATIAFPIPTALQGTAPATIPLWHFDEATARWRAEGTATKTGNTYTAVVNKFSFWNCDVPNSFIKLDLRLINSANNLPLANTLVKITSTVSNTSAYDYTNDSGFVSGYVPDAQALKLEVIAGTACNSNTVAYTQNIGPYSVNTSLGNINVTLPANLVVTFTGKVVNCSNQPVSNGYVSLSLSNGASTIAYTNATGMVNFSLIQCSTGSTYTYTGVDLSNGSYSTTATSTATTNTVNLNTIAACGNSINNSGVYIAGIIDNNAVLWKDGVPTFLTNYAPNDSINSARAYRTLVYNNDVYILGDVIGDLFSSIPKDTLIVWKNGIKNILNPGVGRSCYLGEDLSGIDVYSNDVYVSGATAVTASLNSPNFSSIATIWKNGVPTLLPKDTFVRTVATGVKVVNGDVYVCGYGYSDSTYINSFSTLQRAVYWKNSVLNVLSNISSNSYGGASAIFASNGNIYIAGHNSYKATYWKNGIQTILPLPAPYDESKPYSIFVDNNDIYTAGYAHYSGGAGPSFSDAVYWKNNTINLMTSNNSQANLYDIFVKNSIVYTVGDKEQTTSNVFVPLYFQNNVPVPLTGFTSLQDVAAAGIFVQ
jgi:Carboxypeptidase regulatory-like domain